MQFKYKCLEDAHVVNKGLQEFASASGQDGNLKREHAPATLRKRAWCVRY